MHRTLRASAALLALTGPALAQATNKDPAAVTAGVYAIEPSHTRVTFALDHMGFGDYFGEFTGATGKLTLDPKHPANSHLEVSVPVANVSTSNDKLNGELKDADWLDAEKYPALTFTSTSVKPTGHGTAQVAGNLTIHGVTKPVVLTAKFNGSGTNPIDKAYTTGFAVTGHIKRSDFGVSKYIPLVADDMTLIITAAFEKSAS